MSKASTSSKHQLHAAI